LAVNYPLSVAFLASASDLCPAAAPSPALEDMLAAIVRDARAAWPEVRLDDAAFLRFVGAHLPPKAPPLDALARMHTSDMFLAAACAAKVPGAIETFERHFLSVGSAALARTRLPPDVIAEARQVLRLRFFVEESGSLPKIAEYSGTGALKSWVRAAVVRAALRVARGPKGRVDTDEATLTAAASPANDLELDYLRRLYGAAAQEALRAGFAALEARDRNLLRQYFGLGLGIDEIAALYRVHRSTAARWVTQARRRLSDHTREVLRTRLRIAREDVSSILRLLQSQLEEGIRSLFTKPLEGGA
jgi:RNA polymerase sigma-70 factor, ECF subfamily